VGRDGTGTDGKSELKDGEKKDKDKGEAANNTPHRLLSAECTRHPLVIAGRLLTYLVHA